MVPFRILIVRQRSFSFFLHNYSGISLFSSFYSSSYFFSSSSSQKFDLLRENDVAQDDVNNGDIFLFLASTFFPSFFLLFFFFCNKLHASLGYERGEGGMKLKVFQLWIFIHLPLALFIFLCFIVIAMPSSLSHKKS